MCVLIAIYVLDCRRFWPTWPLKKCVLVTCSECQWGPSFVGSRVCVFHVHDITAGETKSQSNKEKSGHCWFCCRGRQPCRHRDCKVSSCVVLGLNSQLAPTMSRLAPIATLRCRHGTAEAIDDLARKGVETVLGLRSGRVLSSAVDTAKRLVKQS